VPYSKAEDFLVQLNVQIKELIHMINDALKNVSISHAYSVPYISSAWNNTDQYTYYRILTKNFKTESKKKREKKKAVDVKAEELDNESDDESVAESVAESVTESVAEVPLRDDYTVVNEEEDLQHAIHASLSK
jgi:hypothetical protein